MRDLLNKYFPVLDNGFCAVVDYMGNDQAITRAARCSYGAGTKSVSNDRGLIRTLMREQHTSPFEMCEIVLHVGLPIFVARQWIRHRTASLNEYSGRYSVMPSLFYEPEYSRLQKQHTSNRQGSSKDTLNEDEYAVFSENSQTCRKSQIKHYEECLEMDLSRELSRIDLPLSTYTYWYWKIDLKNLLHFLKLRLDEHAQWEIREYAKVIAGMVKQWLPITWEAFSDYVLNSISLSVEEQKALANIIQHFAPCIADNQEILTPDLLELCRSYDMSKRESEAFLGKLCNMRHGHTFKPKYIVDDLDLNKAREPEFYQQMIEHYSIKA